MTPNVTVTLQRIAKVRSLSTRHVFTYKGKAQKGRLDRGLMEKRTASGQRVWYVRLYHHGKEERFGSFPTKTEARNFYDNAKKEQRDGRFFPEQYQRSASETVQSLLNDYLLTTTGKRAIKREQGIRTLVGPVVQRATTPRSPTRSH